MRNTILISYPWTGVGEQFLNAGYRIYVIRLLRELMNIDWYVIWNIDTVSQTKQPLHGAVTELVEHCYNSSGFLEYADEFYIDNEEYFHRTIDNKLFINIDSGMWVDASCSLDTINFIKVFILNKYNAEKFNYSEFGPPRAHDISSEECRIENDVPELINAELYDIANNFLNQHGIDEFQCIHFRAEPTFEQYNGGMASTDRMEIVNYWLDRLEPLIDPAVTYILCSNSNLFFQKFQERHKNSIYIDRELSAYEYWPLLTSGQRTLTKPKIIPEYLFQNMENLSEQTKALVYSNYIAYIENALMCKSTRNIHMSDGHRHWLSLFLIYPTMFKRVPLVWIENNFLIHRKYSQRGCYFHEIIPDDRPRIIPPQSLCKHSAGVLC